MKRLLTAILTSAMMTASYAADYIRINQLGYIPKTTKVAVFLSNETRSVGAFEVCDAYTHKVVYRSAQGEVTATAPYGKMLTTCRLNFSKLTTPGTYYIRVGNSRSADFAINGAVYNGTADFVLNYLRQNRCGFNPYLNAHCHQKDGYIVYHPTKTGQYIDVRGGWHDASDCLQYTTTTANAIYQLMFAYSQNPEVFGDYHKTDGLAGANGIPDIVDEIRWGMDWLNRMNPEKGELYNQLADDRDHVGMRLPQNDPADYGYGPNNGRPVYFCTGEPQQRGKYMNATMGVASTAGKFASDFAFGSQVLKPFYPELAEIIGAKAADAYQVGLDKPGNCQTVSVVSPYIYEEDNWVDDMELGAIELYRKTGDKKYLQQALEYGRREPVTPWMGADSVKHYQIYPFMNMGHYQLAMMGGERIKREFIRNIKSGLQRVYERAKELDSPFMNGVPSVWCSNNLTSALITQCILYRQLTGDTTYQEMEGSLRDWLFGCNPWGVSMVVELPLGGNYPRQPHSSLVYENVGNTTGGLVDGPVYKNIFDNLRGVNLVHDVRNGFGPTNYDDFQMDYMVFHDNMHDYSTNEPTMDGTASLTFPLSTYQMEGMAQSGVAADRNVYSHGGVVRGDVSKKNICLVFTGHNMAEGGEKILNTLKRNKVKGAFFITGEFANLFPELLKRMKNEGHYVGSHSYGHLLYAAWENPDSLLVTKQEFVDDIKRSFESLAQHGIAKSDAPYFIPPFEWYNSTVASWAKELGLQVVNFTPGTGSSNDYTTPSMGAKYCSSKKLWNDIMKCEKTDPNGLNGHILMVHMGTDPERTDKFYNRLPALIKTLKKKGYNFVSLEEMVGLNMK